MMTGHHDLRGFGPFVAETHDAATVGVFGPWHPEGQPEPELRMDHLGSLNSKDGALLLKPCRSTRAFAARTLGWITAASYIHPGNARSLRLARRVGARPDGKSDNPARHAGRCLAPRSGGRYAPPPPSPPTG